MSTSNVWTLDRIARYLFFALIVVGVFYLLNYLSGAILPFVVAVLIAYLIHPVVEFFQFRLKFQKKGLAIGATLLTFTLNGILLWLWLVPAIGGEISKFGTLVNQYAQSWERPAFIPENIYERISKFMDSEDVQGLMTGENAKEALSYVFSGFQQTFLGIFGGIGLACNSCHCTTLSHFYSC